MNKKKTHSAHKTAPAPPKGEARAFRLAERFYWPLAALVLLATGFYCFYALDGQAVMSWDEARHGVSACEMLRSGDYLVNTYGGQPDYWNVKPPLSFWAIALCYRVFGTTVLGMRFYAALSQFLTVALVLLFARRRYGAAESLLAGACVGGCAMFYYLHFARNGDADALFTLLMTACLLCLLTLAQHPRRAWLCGLLFSLSFLAKSWHALLIVGVAGLYIFVGGLCRRLRPCHWAAGIAAALGPILLWAALRCRYDRLLFLGKMVGYDLVARVVRPLEQHGGSFFYYFRLPLRFSYVAGVFLLAVGLYFLLLPLQGRKSGAPWPAGDALRGDLPLYLLWLAVPFALFTIARTKLSWYILPAMVPAAALAGLLAARLLRQANAHRAAKVACAALLALALAGDARRITAVWGQYPPDGLQLFITQELAGRAAAAVDAPAYLQVPAGPYSDMGGTQTVWSQNYQFLAEAYLDVQCQEGGAEGYLQDPRGVLLISRPLYEADGRLGAASRTLLEGDGFLLLQRAGE